jgi:predicted transcriptional regulator with HTH domain
VIGALRGMNTRYREDESLISLELVEEKSGGKNIRLYALTEFGKEIIDTIHIKR